MSKPIAAVLLAAGRSTRFGAADKVTAELGGRPLVRHAADRLLALRLAAYVVVTGPAPAAPDCPGFTAVANDRPEAGLSRSIALGVAAARASGVEAVLIALADMPLVTADHFGALVGRWQQVGGIVASSDGTLAMPPAIFGAGWFDTLERLSGDRGARVLLDRADRVLAPGPSLIDIDRIEDLHRAERLLGGHEER